jgi:hypothetical protein
MTAGYLPTSAVISWVTASGTTTFSADWRSFQFNPSQDKFESTAGTTTSKTYITGSKDFTASYGGLHPASTAGTAILTQCAIGQAGTLTFQSQGTATGMPKIIMPCFITNEPVSNFAYAGLVEVVINWQGNGPYTSGVN